MSPEGNELDRILDGIRNEAPAPEAVEAAAERVRARLPHAALRTCADFRALMPDYRAGRLPEARALLLKDHTGECVACRKALAGESKVAAFTPARRATSAPWFRWAMAAGAAGVAVLAGWGIWDGLRTGASPTMVQAASGTVWRVTPRGIQTLAAGAEAAGEGEIRTAGDSRALLRLRDGSLVEMRERSSLSITEAGRDLTIHLAGGNVIVEAAKRRSGHLYVAARDCRVSVTGTVFSVNSGVKGSRVSVLEGEVRVAQAGREQVLHAGDQYSSSAAVTPVPVAEEIAWSARFQQHMTLVNEFAALGKRLEQVRMPDLRYSSRLTAMLPAETVVYASIPNIGRAIGEAHAIMRQRAAESPVLREWWEGKTGGGEVNQALERLQEVSEYLGDEIVVAAIEGAGGRLAQPVVMAEVKRTGLKEFLAGRGLRAADSLEELGPVVRGQAVVYAGKDLAVMSGDAEAMRKVLAGGGFAGTPFGARVAETYRDGAGFVFAADLERLAARRGAANRDGAPNFKYAVAEQKQTGGRTDTSAVLVFQGARKGPAGWLGRPAPMGALDYVSPEAGFAASFILKDPAAIFDELVAHRGAEALERAEAELGINIRNDLLASLGGEIAVAYDGPAVPVPSWKIAAEVRDANRLQWSVQKIVEAYNRHAAAGGRPPAELTQETAGGRTWHRLAMPGVSRYGEAHYTFDNGYVVAAPSRALVEQALGYRASGHTLTRSAAFAALLPRNRYADFSGMVYQNMGSSLGPLFEALSAQNLTAEQKEALDSAAKGAAGPMLVTCYGEEDRITVAGGGSLLALSPANLLRLGGPLASLSSLMSSHRRQAHPPRVHRQ